MKDFTELVDNVDFQKNTQENPQNLIEDITPSEINEKPTIEPYMLESPNFVGYENIEDQEHMYNLCSFGIFNPSITSLVDLGCGRGDFGHYVKSTINSNINYIGVDVNPVMINTGNEKYKNKFTDPDSFKLINANYYDNLEIKGDWVVNLTNLTIPYGYHNGDSMEQFKDLLEISLQICEVGCVFMLLNDKQQFPGYFQYNIGSLTNYLDQIGVRYAVDYTDKIHIFKLVIFKQPFI